MDLAQLNCHANISKLSLETGINSAHTIYRRVMEVSNGDARSIVAAGHGNAASLHGGDVTTVGTTLMSILDPQVCLAEHARQLIRALAGEPRGAAAVTQPAL
jgi:hypothetical protein